MAYELRILTRMAKTVKVKFSMGLNIPLFSGYPLLPFPPLLTPLPLKKNAFSGPVDCQGTDTDRLRHRLRTSEYNMHLSSRKLYM